MGDDGEDKAEAWDEAARGSERSWDKEPGKHRDAPEPSIDDAMERTEEGYGSGKEGVDPGADEPGSTPEKPAG